MSESEKRKERSAFSLAPSTFLFFFSLSLSPFGVLILCWEGPRPSPSFSRLALDRAQDDIEETTATNMMEDDRGPGGGGEAPGGEQEGGQIGVIEGKKVEAHAAPPAVEEELQAPSLDGRTLDTDSGARAEGSGLAGTGDGEAAAVLAASPSPLFVDNVDDSDVKVKEHQVFECFVGGLPREATEGELLSYFADLNPLSARLSRRRRGDNCKGYGFVVFPSAELAQRACGRERTTVRVEKKDCSIAPSPLLSIVSISRGLAVVFRTEARTEGGKWSKRGKAGTRFRRIFWFLFSAID